MIVIRNFQTFFVFAFWQIGFPATFFSRHTHYMLRFQFHSCTNPTPGDTDTSNTLRVQRCDCTHSQLQFVTTAASVLFHPGGTGIYFVSRCSRTAIVTTIVLYQKFAADAGQVNFQCIHRTFG